MKEPSRNQNTPRIKYASDKPKNCKGCYYWSGSRYGCKLGESQCYYILPQERSKKEKSPCDGCPYGRVNPCIGYCIKNLRDKQRQAGDQ